MDAEERSRIDGWMTRLAAGEREAFDPLFAALWPIVHGFAERSLGRGPDAEDAAQTALLKVFARASEFEPDRDAVAWVVGIVAFECRTARTRARRGRVDLVPDEALARSRAPFASPEDEVIREDLAHALSVVAGSLRPTDAETLRRLVSEDRPKGAGFRKRVERMLSRLRAAWRSSHDVE